MPAFPVQRPKRYRVRAFYQKTGLLRFLSHREVVRVFQRALARIHAPIAYSQGFHPHPQLVFGPALPVGVEGLREPVDFFFSDMIDIENFVDKMNRTLPAELNLLGAEAVELKTVSLAAALNQFVFWVVIPAHLVAQGYTLTYIRQKIEAFRRQPAFRVNGVKKHPQPIDIVPCIPELDVTTGEEQLPRITMSLRRWTNMMIKPQEVLSLVFDIPYEKSLECRILRVSLEAEN
jgi:radical SAM-linked protein